MSTLDHPMWCRHKTYPHSGPCEVDPFESQVGTMGVAQARFDSWSELERAQRRGMLEDLWDHLPFVEKLAMVIWWKEGK